VPTSTGWYVVWLPLLMGILVCRTGEERPPHVIVVSADTLNRNALRCFAGSAPPLPALDAFAEKSIRLVNAYSTASWTLPAHASLLTGLYPDRHGANKDRRALGIGVSTVAEALRSRGYETVAFTGGGFLHAAHGFSQGFDRYDEHLTKGAEAAAIRLPREGRPPTFGGEDLFARAIAFVSERPLDAGPLFLFLHTYSVHNYYRLSEWALARFGESIEVEASKYFACLQGRRHCSPQDWERIEAIYRVEVEHFEAGFGRLVAALERAKLWDRSVVFLLSDHGEGFDAEHGRIHHGGRLHADQLHIPLVVRVPGQAPHDVTTPVSLVDLMPTILELTGTPPVSDLDGRSFAAVLHGEPAPSEARSLYAMEHYYTWSDEEGRIEVRGSGRRPTAVAVIAGPYWYIRERWGEELYDMRTDRWQRRNLAPEVVDLDAYRRLIARRSGRKAAPNPVEPDEELAKQLRSLGYGE
jgi:arylsulfatase A-like enzyme